METGDESYVDHIGVQIDTRKKHVLVSIAMSNNETATFSMSPKTALGVADALQRGVARLNQ